MALESEILKISKDTLSIQRKNISALELLKDIEKKIENQLLMLKMSKEEAPTIIKDE